MSTRLQVGDIVVCVEGKQNTNGYIIKSGEVYEIVEDFIRYAEQYVRVKHVGTNRLVNANLYASRFELSTEKGISPIIRKIRSLESRWKSRNTDRGVGYAV